MLLNGNTYPTRESKTIPWLEQYILYSAQLEQYPNKQNTITIWNRNNMIETRNRGNSRIRIRGDWLKYQVIPDILIIFQKTELPWKAARPVQLQAITHDLAILPANIIP